MIETNIRLLDWNSVYNKHLQNKIGKKQQQRVRRPQYRFQINGFRSSTFKQVHTVYKRRLPKYESREYKSSNYVKRN